MVIADAVTNSYLLGSVHRSQVVLYTARRKEKLRGIRQAAVYVARFTKGKSFEDHANDLLLSANVEREFEIIGKPPNGFTQITKRAEEKRSQKRGSDLSTGFDPHLQIR